MAVNEPVPNKDLYRDQNKSSEVLGMPEVEGFPTEQELGSGMTQGEAATKTRSEKTLTLKDVESTVLPGDFAHSDKRVESVTNDKGVLPEDLRREGLATLMNGVLSGNREIDFTTPDGPDELVNRLMNRESEDDASKPQ